MRPLQELSFRQTKLVFLNLPAEVGQPVTDLDVLQLPPEKPEGDHRAEQADVHEDREARKARVRRKQYGNRSARDERHKAEQLEADLVGRPNVRAYFVVELPRLVVREVLDPVNVLGSTGVGFDLKETLPALAVFLARPANRFPYL